MKGHINIHKLRKCNLKLEIAGKSSSIATLCPARACRIGNHQSITEKLSHELHMRSLTTSFTGPAELEIRLLELGALRGGLVNFITTIWEGHCEVPIGFLFLNDLLCRSQGQCISRANADAQLTACAIPWGDLDAVLVVVQDTTSNCGTAAILESCWCLCELLSGGQEWSDCRMGADETALVALSALVHVNLGHVDGNTTFLVLTCTTWHSATGHEGTHRKCIAIEVVAGRLDLLRKLLCILHLWEHPWPLAISNLLLLRIGGLQQTTRNLCLLRAHIGMVSKLSVV